MKAVYKIVIDELPDASEAECRRILQSTDYPFCSLERLEYQIKSECIEYRRKKVLG